MAQTFSPKKINRKHLFLIALLFGVIGTVTVIKTFAATTSTISGRIWQDTNRNGLFDEGEVPLANNDIYLMDPASNTFIKHVYSDSAGLYTLPDLADGQYRIQLSASSWWALRRTWVPTTGNSLRYYMKDVLLNSSATADIGLREIVRSTDENAPITSFSAPSGLKVNSYVDVVTAKEVYDTLAQGSLFGGAESPYTEVRFALNEANVTTAAVQSSNGGPYEKYSATSYFSYIRWLDDVDRTLFHEYGHAWSMYYAYIVQQDPLLVEYQRIRGIYGDPRVNSNYQWQVREMIAEDYRQLFGSASAMKGNSQTNWEAPLPTDPVFIKDGKNILKEYLKGDFINKDSFIPSAPRDFRGDGISTTQIKLDWSASVDNLGIAGYDIYRNGQKVDSVDGSTLTYTDNGLNSAATYNYYLKARDASGNTSPASNIINVNTLAPPPNAPTNLQASKISDNTASLTWTASTGSTSATDYDIYRDNQKVGSVNSPSTTYFDTGLQPTTTYTYSVKARDASGTSSEPSNVITVKTLPSDTQAPAKPSSFKLASTTSTSASFTWTASTDNVGVAGYRIYKVGSSTPMTTVITNKGTVSGLSPNTQYSFYVTAVDQTGNESLPSNTVKTRTARR